LDDLLAEGPVIVAVPHYAAVDLVPGLDVDGLGASPIVNLHVHYDRRVLDESLAAALDSPVQFVFDRTEASGARPITCSRCSIPTDGGRANSRPT
jgi:hypothetical protein